MKSILFTLAAALALIFAPQAAHAQAKIAVVNIQQIMSDSKAAQSIQGQLDKHRKSFQDEFSQYERTLMDKEKALAEQRAEMPAEEFSKQRETFENEVLETRKLVQKRQRALEEAAAEALNKLRNEVLQIVADMAEKEKYDLVITRQNIILAQKDMEITDAVMAALDKKLTKVDLKVETN